MTEPAPPTPPDARTARRQPVPPPPVQYKGGDLDAARGPGLGCFYVQLVILVALLVATPLTVGAGWPPIVSMALLVAIIVLLLFTGQTMIFLLRLVAADRGRRRPLASQSRTVGDIDAEESAEAGEPETASADAATEPHANGAPEPGGSVRE